MLKPKRITLFCGHYGSGKTNIAVNYAMYLKDQGHNTVIADLDIVNPYFRTKDSEEKLKEHGIDVISLPFANSNVDLPSLPSSIYSLTQNKTRYAVIDVGGDDRGAYALGRITPAILEENDYDMFCVVNFKRPLTKTAEEALEVMREIEGACGISFTGIINNTNIGEETTLDVIKQSYSEAEKLSSLSSLPIVMTTADIKTAEDGMFSLSLQEKYY